MIKNLSIFANDPEMLRLLEARELSALLKRIADKPTIDLAKEMMKGDKGDKGDDGENREILYHMLIIPYCLR